MQCAVGEHFDFIKLLNFSFILLVLCKYFDFIPTYVLFCMRPLPPPPHISLFKLYVLFSLLGIGGGERLIDLTFSLCSFTPPPPLPRTYMGLFTFSHYSNPSVFRQYSSYIPFSNSFLRTLCQYLYIFANIFMQYIITFCVRKFLSIFREHYANVWTFLQTFSRSFQHCSMSGFHLPLPVYVNQ
jgi:hypothetical protein